MTGLRTDRIPKHVADELWPATETNNETDNNVQDQTISTDVSTVVVDAGMPPPTETDDAPPYQPDLLKAKPDDPFPIPKVTEAYQRAPDLEALAEDLLKRDDQIIDDLRWRLQGARIKYVWREKGGTSRGAPSRARTVRMAGLGRHWARADFTIVVAADHAKDSEMTYEQMRALLFRELMRVEKRVTDDGEESHHIRRPTIEAFPEELQLFGLWEEGLQAGAEAFEQMGLEVD